MSVENQIQALNKITFPFQAFLEMFFIWENFFNTEEFMNC